jgi:DNA-directed RNA polymerase specialized sigma24 family protein
MADSISNWIRGLKAGDAAAAQKLWERYAKELVDLARKKIGSAPKSIADEEDVAQSVFSSICRGAAAGRFGNVKSRDELWWLLLTVSKQKAVDHIRRETAQKRGAGQVRTEVEFAVNNVGSGHFTLDDIVGTTPTPDFLVMLQEQYDHLLSILNDKRLREIAIARVEGYTVPEIAARQEICTRAVERKLQIIRSKWAKQLSDVDEQ